MPNWHRHTFWIIPSLMYICDHQGHSLVYYRISFEGIDGISPNWHRCRDKLKLIDFHDFDPIYMVIGTLSSDFLNQWMVF